MQDQNLLTFRITFQENIELGNFNLVVGRTNEIVVAILTSGIAGDKHEECTNSMERFSYLTSIPLTGMLEDTATKFHYYCVWKVFCKASLRHIKGIHKDRFQAWWRNPQCKLQVENWVGLLKAFAWPARLDYSSEELWSEVTRRGQAWKVRLWEMDKPQTYIAGLWKDKKLQLLNFN